MTTEIAVGLKKGHAATKRKPAPRPGARKGVGLNTFVPTAANPFLTALWQARRYDPRAY